MWVIFSRMKERSRTASTSLQHGEKSHPVLHGLLVRKVSEFGFTLVRPIQFTGKGKVMIKFCFKTFWLIFFGVFLSWLLLNIAMGCGMVNNWDDPACMTPAEMIRGQ
jgi:hypothetical protein